MQMKNILTEWKNFLLKEEYEVTVNPNDYESFADFRKDFFVAMKNKPFVETFMDAFMRLELRPFVKNLPEEDRKNLFRNVKLNAFVPNTSFIQNKIIPNISDNSILAKAGLKYDSYTLYDWLSYYVNYFTDQKAKQKFEKQISNTPIKAESIYWELFKKYPEEIPTVSKLYKPDTSTQNRRENIRILKLKPEDLTKPNILDDIKIVNQIGKGAFGTVYELEDGRAFKVFSSGVDVDKDIERYEKIIDQVYKGKASMEDMHVFDYGKLGETNYYYAIMPKIIPLNSTDIFKENAIFHAVAKANKEIAQRGRATEYETFKRLVLAEAGTFYFQAKDKYGNSNLSFQQAYNKYSDIVDKIIKAGWRAYSEYGGIDIHSGNIGSFPNKPEEYFYFDM
jgi:hypothetical protein